MTQFPTSGVDKVPSHSQSATWRALDRRMPPKREAAERVGDFGEIYGLLDAAEAMRQASRCLQCAAPSCVHGCPLSNHIPEWLALTAAGRFLEAAEKSHATSPFPEICSRICPQERLCESSCVLESRTDPVAIGAIEQFINEYAFAHGAVAVEPAEPNGHSVAVIGAGPAGLACADQLAAMGCAVTVFEGLERAGGLLIYGIPAFKLDKDIVERRVDILRRRGVRFELGVWIGKDRSLDSIRKQFDAVFWGVGAQKPKPAGVPGADIIGVHEALPFLVEKNLPGSQVSPPIDVRGKRVAVLGGGDTAMDCLRTAVRAGAAEAVCLYRRDFDNMPGSRKEYYNAREEGAQFQFLTNPVEILGDASGCVTGVRCVRMELGEPGAGGRRRPIAVAGSEFDFAADIVLIAYGFDPVTPPLSAAGKVEVNAWGGLVLDDRQMTSLPGLFAGGDAFRGPALVSEAACDGRRAAAGIAQWLTCSATAVARGAGKEQVAT